MSVSSALIPAEALYRKSRHYDNCHKIYYCVLLNRRWCGGGLVKHELKTCTLQFIVRLLMYRLNTLNLNRNDRNLTDISLPGINIFHCIFTAFRITTSFIVMNNM
jgi:hypothetical protein